VEGRGRRGKGDGGTETPRNGAMFAAGYSRALARASGRIREMLGASGSSWGGSGAGGRGRELLQTIRVNVAGKWN